MKYFVVSAHKSPITGAHQRFDRLVVSLVEANEVVTWLTPKRKSLIFQNRGLMSSKVNFLDCNLMSTEFLMPQLLLSLFRWLPELLRLRHQVDKIVTFGETTLAAALAAKLILGCPLSVGIRSNYLSTSRILVAESSGFGKLLMKFKTGVNLVVLRIVYNNTDQFVVQSEFARKRLSEDWSVPLSKVQVLNNDLPQSFLDKAPLVWAGNAARKILFVGDGTAIKGLDLLVDALKMIDLEGLGIREVTFVGVSDDRCGDFKESLMSQGVVLNTFERTVKISELMLDHDLLVVPSREDSFPNVVLEALALKMPVIGSDAEGIEYILVDKRFMFKSGQARDLADKLLLLEEDCYYAELVDNSFLQRSRFMFDWAAKYSTILSHKE